MDLMRSIEGAHIKSDLPEFGPGDTVRLSVRVVEGDKTRAQVFQGVVMGRSNSGVRETVTLRKVSDGVAVERIFPIHSPNVQSIEVVRRGRVRRARLTYLRGRKGRSARIREHSALPGRREGPAAEGPAAEGPAAGKEGAAG